jgi:GLPGLI family protein
MTETPILVKIFHTNNDLDIEYKDETLTIENYLCKLAIIKIGNITSQVWYTEEIPVSAGPFIYNNLPGLVLKIERPNFLCYTTHVSNDFDEKEVKKMDTQLKIYQGEELKLKLKEGLEKMRNYNKELTEMNKKKIMEMYK